MINIFYFIFEWIDKLNTYRVVLVDEIDNTVD